MRLVPRSRISPEAVKLYKRAREIQFAGKDDGSLRNEYHDCCVALHSLLGRKLWEEDVLDISGDDPPSHIVGEGGEKLADWRTAHLIRRELERLTGR